MIKDLRRKFVLVNMICVTLILATVFTSIFLINSKQLKTEGLLSLNRALNFTDMKMSSKGEAGFGGELKKNEADNFVVNVNTIDNNHMGVVLISVNNIVIMQEDVSEVLPYTNQNVEDIIEEVLDEMYKGNNTGEIKSYKLRYMADENMNGINIAFMDLSNEYSQKKQMFIACVVAGFVAMCGFFLVSLFLSRWALKPVEKAWNSQRQFAADASHELKTPLTVILANMDILKSHKTDKIADRIEWVNNTQAEAQRMKELANNLLYLTKSGDMKKPQILEKVNLSDAITKTALAFEPVAFESKISIDTFIQSDVFIHGDQSQMKQLATILIDNAVKYSFDDTIVKISLKEISSRAVLEVNDIGVVIAKEDLNKVFGRFYRSDESRSEEGYGLGLSIAKNIVEQHKGTISVKSDVENGTTFIVSLPVYR